MKSQGTLSAVAFAALASTVLAATPAITITGNAFFSGSTRFYIRGVDYQPGGASSPVDPIANAVTCQRDIVEFKKLGINTVRVYTVDNTANHDVCMQALSDAGIYLALDVNNSKYSINRANPQPSYNNVYLQSVFATIDAFAGYSNTLLFFSGNEVINDATNTDCAPYIKAVTRDMKQYITARGHRAIPVGYSAADVTENRYQTAAYMNCGDATVRSDFFSFNDYSWCDPNTFQGSGWAAKVATYMNYSIPLFLSEYGCIQNPPRAFQEVAALYNTEMTNVYSGGLVYEYSEETGNAGFGLVNIVSTTSVTEKTDFTNLQSMLAANPAPSGGGGYQTGLAPLACPTSDANWQVGTALPALPSAASAYMSAGAGTGPGLTGAGSQNGGSVNSVTTTVVTSTATGTTSRSTSGAATVTSTATGAATAAATTTHKAAANKLQLGSFDSAPMIVGGIVAAFALVGAGLL